MKQLTQEQWWKISNNTSSPVGLEEANLDADFVYDREYGFFIVNFGCHNIIMAMLFAFKLGFASYLDMDGPMEDIADRWLMLKGTCFQSSQASKPYVWKLSHLSISEMRVFGKNGLTEIG